jgi:hypothetical protein
MNIQMDKFNIIYKLTPNEINYKSIIKNYLENYFESNIYIYHSVINAVQRFPQRSLEPTATRYS